MTDREKAIITAYTGITMLTGDKFSIFHKYIEDILGRSVWTHELADHDVWEEIKEKSKSDFLELCKNEETREWIPIKMRPGTDEEYEDFCKYGDCPREDFRVFESPMPDNEQEVLVTTRWGNVCVDTWYSDVDGCYFEYNSDDDDVIAWMPIPAAYKPEVQHEDS